MDTLADAVICALVYLGTVPDPGAVDRSDDDIRELELMTTILQNCTPKERKALHAALDRARAFSAHVPALSEVFDIIETDILDARTE